MKAMRSSNFANFGRRWAKPSPAGLTQCDRTEVELMISDTLDCSAAENNETKPGY